MHRDGQPEAAEMIGDVQHPRIACWLRDPAPAGSWPVVDEHIARLRRLADEGHVADFRVNVWGKCVRCPADEEDSVADSWAVYREFEAWASATGHSLEPAFRRRAQQTIGTDASCSIVEVPVLCLAIYTREDLAAVLPCSTVDGNVTVGEYVAHLERRREERVADPSGETIPG